MKIHPLLFCVPLLLMTAGCQLLSSEEEETKETLSCDPFKFNLTREQRMSGILLPAKLETITFGKGYTREELIAQYRLVRVNSERTKPTEQELATARRIITERSGGRYDPKEVIIATPCMYIPVIPPSK